MRILVDADACPSRNIIEDLSKEYGAELHMYCDFNHVIRSDYGEVHIVESGYQSVDMVLFNSCQERDIVVTGDFGVAAMVLGKKAYAISPKGYIFSDNNIDKLLFERHISQKVRKGGGKTSNPKKRTLEDDNRLREGLFKLIKKLL